MMPHENNPHREPEAESVGFWGEVDHDLGGGGTGGEEDFAGGGCAQTLMGVMTAVAVLCMVFSFLAILWAGFTAAAAAAKAEGALYRATADLEVER